MLTSAATITAITSFFLLDTKLLAAVTLNLNPNL
jgi:hypothetical protein